MWQDSDTYTEGSFLSDDDRSDVLTSSEYESSDSPYVPVKGNRRKIYTLTDSEFSDNPQPVRKRYVKSMYESDSGSLYSSSSSDCSPLKKKTKTQSQKQKKSQVSMDNKGKKSSQVPMDQPLPVLKLPILRNVWVTPAAHTKMNPCDINPCLVRFLDTLPKIEQESILFKDIPEVTDEHFGSVRWLVAVKIKKNDQGERYISFVVVPNVALSSKSLFYYRAPNNQWFSLKAGSGEKRKNDYHIPAPFSDRQTITTAMKNNFI